MSRRALFAAVVVLAAALTTAPAREDAAAGASAADLLAGVGKPAKAALEGPLCDPDTWNAMYRHLTGLLPPEHWATALIRDLNIEFKSFEGVDDEAFSLGVAYDFTHPIAGSGLSERSDWAYGLDLRARGNVAFDRDANPNDFLETGAKLHLYRSAGGFVPSFADRTACQRALQEANLKAARYTSREELERSDEWRDVRRLVQQGLRTQYLLDLAANVSLESNQDFSDRQMAYGLQLGGVIRAWNDESAWAKFNVLDYPFAAIRYVGDLARFGRAEWQPSGRALPLVLAGLDLVDPAGNDRRLAADPDKDP
jgi:hypothetical protein